MIHHMNSQILSSSSLLFTLNFLIVLLQGQPDDVLYQKCGNKFSCGNIISAVGYPFRGSDVSLFCGHPSLVLYCEAQTNATTIDIMGAKYRVLEIDQTAQTMRVSREDVMDGNSSCPREKTNTTLDHSVFDYAPGYTNVTFLYGCPVLNSSYGPAGSSYVSCGINNDVYDEGAYVVPGVSGPGECTVSVVVPVPDGGTNTTGLGQVLRQGFQIKLKIGEDTCNECVVSKGRCGYDDAMNRTTCYCPCPPYSSYNICSMASGVSPNTTVPSRPAGM